MDKQFFQDVDLKATPARIAVLDLLRKEAKPVDVNTIIKYLDENNIATNPATVFRIMNVFTEKGITRQIQFHEGKARYELATDNDHHHFICERCGAIEDISDCSIGDLEQEIMRKKHMIIKRHSLEFFGLCQNCAATG